MKIKKILEKNRVFAKIWTLIRRFLPNLIKSSIKLTNKREKLEALTPALEYTKDY